jgi:hypothetical protein
MVFNCQGGNAHCVDAFKYLGGVHDTTATWDKETHLLNTKARGRFAGLLGCSICVVFTSRRSI